MHSKPVNLTHIIFILDKFLNNYKLDAYNKVYFKKLFLLYIAQNYNPNIIEIKTSELHKTISILTKKFEALSSMKLKHLFNKNIAFTSSLLIQNSFMKLPIKKSHFAILIDKILYSKWAGVSLYKHSYNSSEGYCTCVVASIHNKHKIKENIDDEEMFSFFKAKCDKKIIKDKEHVNQAFSILKESKNNQRISSLEVVLVIYNLYLTINTKGDL